MPIERFDFGPKESLCYTLSMANLEVGPVVGADTAPKRVRILKG